MSRWSATWSPLKTFRPASSSHSGSARKEATTLPPSPENVAEEAAMEERGDAHRIPSKTIRRTTRPDQEANSLCGSQFHPYYALCFIYRCEDVRFVGVIRDSVSLCARVSRTCPVCVPAPPGVFLPVGIQYPSCIALLSTEKRETQGEKRTVYMYFGLSC